MTEHRRKFVRSMAVGGGAVIIGKSLPELWSKPVIDSVLLPAHAQTSVPTRLPGATYTQTISSGELCSVLGTGSPVPDPAPFLFDWDTGGFTPTGDGTLTVTATGDLTGNEGPLLEAWQIAFNGGPFLVPFVGNTDSSLVGETTTTEIYTISLADLLLAAPGLNVPVTATNQGRVDCDPGLVNNMTLTLTFPATV